MCIRDSISYDAPRRRVDIGAKERAKVRKVEYLDITSYLNVEINGLNFGKHILFSGGATVGGAYWMEEK